MKCATRYLLGSLCGALIAVVSILACVRSPMSGYEQTETTMVVLKKRILAFARQNGRLPSTLNDLSPPYATACVDAWGATIDYAIEANNRVRLTSLGSDRKLGGTGSNEDIVRFFDAKDTKGSWSNGADLDERDGWTTHHGPPKHGRKQDASESRSDPPVR